MKQNQTKQSRISSKISALKDSIIEKAKPFIAKIGGVRTVAVAGAVLLAIIVALVLIFVFKGRAEEASSPADSRGETVTAAVGDSGSSSESDSEPASEAESVSKDETKAESKSTADASSEASSETSAAVGTAPAQNQDTSKSDAEIDVNVGTSGGSGGGTSSSGGSGSGGSGSGSLSGESSSPIGSVETAGRVHTYADAPSNEYEDTSSTLSFMPLRQEGATDPGGVYNKIQIYEDDIKPGVLMQGSSAYSTTLVGYDGFLFCGDSFADYDGTAKYTDARISGIKKMMTDRNKYIESIGKKLYVLIVPNKNTVYYDYMPEGYTMGSYRRIDQVVSALKEAGIKVIDGRESLMAAKAANPARCLYYKTDTHWNNHGAFEVYKQMMSVIQKDFPNVVVHSRSDYQINYCETYMKDQAYYLGYYDATHEIGPVYTLKSGKTAKLTDFEPKESWGQFAFCYQWPNGYSDKLYKYQWTNTYNSDAPSMYMIRDSYSIALNGFLKDSFYKSTYNWTYRFSKSEIQKSDADVVIIEVCEKYIADMLNQSALSQ